MKHAHCSSNRKRGFSFTEIAIALLILAIGLIPVFYVFSRGSAGTVLAREEITAHQLAGEMIDAATLLGYDDARLADGQLDGTQLPNVSPDDPRFQRTLLVTDVRPAGGWKDWPVAYKILTARVSWDNSGVVRTFTLTGLLYKGVVTTP